MRAHSRAVEEQTKALAALEQSQRELAGQLVRRVEVLEANLNVGEDGGNRSAEAYDALRKTVQSAMRTRTSMLVALAEIDRTLRESSTLDEPRKLVALLLNQEQLVTTLDPSEPTAFRIIGGEGDSLAPITPAYVDEATGKVISRGTARLVDPSGTRPGASQ